jgi:hypothetical protein
MKTNKTITVTLNHECLRLPRCHVVIIARFPHWQDANGNLRAPVRITVF